MTMRTIRLGGWLGEKYGKKHVADLSGVAEAIRMFVALFPDFKRDLSEAEQHGYGFSVTVADREVSEEELTLVSEGDILIMPVIIGASAAGRMLLGAAMLTFALTNPLGWLEMGTQGAFGLSLMGSMGAGLIVGGVIQMLTPVPKLDQRQSSNSLASYTFAGPSQTSKQGTPIPVMFGQMLRGGIVISCGISVEDMPHG